MDSFNVNISDVTLPVGAKLYKNGDRCPCCGRVLEGKEDEWLLWFSAVVRIAGITEEAQDDGES